ncbi:hypothetical protein ACSUZJ_08360 [Telluria sp. B2]
MSSDMRRAHSGSISPVQCSRRIPHEGIDERSLGGSTARIVELSSTLGLPPRTLLGCLGISRARMNRLAQANQPPSLHESERVLGVENLIYQVQAMVADGAPGKADGFNAARWLGRWILKPLPALGRRLPASYLHTIEGQKFVGGLLAMYASGAYA